MLSISEHQDTDFSREQVAAIVSLLNGIWPRTQKTLDELVEAFIDAAQAYVREQRCVPLRYVNWEGDRAVAQAKTFERTINTSNGPLPVMALSGVCVESGRRGEGLGVALVRRAFACVDAGKFPVSLFQTGVPGFYEKLGARVVKNRFVNARNEEDPEANPWHEDYVMIYPSGYAWPDGVIDLNGSSY